MRRWTFFGATIGRFGNRLAGGAFKLDGKRYQVPLNDGPNSLHGGAQGFDKHVWKATPVKAKDSVGVTLTYLSKDGEMGFPGNLKTEVTYRLNDNNELHIDYKATTDKPTEDVDLTLPGEFEATSLRNPPGKVLWSQRLPEVRLTSTGINLATSVFAVTPNLSFSSWKFLPSFSLANRIMIGRGKLWMNLNR